MIQEIAPDTLDNAFAHRRAPKGSDYVLLTASGTVYLDPETNLLPTVERLLRDSELAERDLQYLLKGGDDVALWTVLDVPDALKVQYHDESVRFLRGLQPDWLRLAAVTGLHLHSWYKTHRFCGRCGKPLRPDDTERAMRCDACGNLVFPTISPAIIVGITDGDRIVLTRSAVVKNPVYALVAGYMEIGETMEQTVAREAMEEVGLKLKNIRYCGNQPWGFSGSQMYGFWAELDGSDQITRQESELREAGWFHRDEVPASPHPIDLTHQMMEWFRTGVAPKD